MMAKHMLVLFLFIYNSWGFTFPEDNRYPNVEEFLEDIIQWIRDKNPHMRARNVMKEEDCMIMNFGYTKELQFHGMSLSSRSPVNISMGTLDMKAPNTCWIALVAGSDLQNVESILMTVESLSQQMQKTAYAVFLLGDVEDIEVIRNHWTPPVVKIGFKKRTSPNMIFDFTCEGNSIGKSSRLLLRKGKPNKPINEVCPETLINIAFNQYPANFEMDYATHTNMIKYKTEPGIYWDYELMELLFQNYNLTPFWIDNNYTWGWFDEEIMSWNGAVEMVRNNSADFGITMFGCSHERSTAVQCSHSISFAFERWVTKSPGPIPPYTNMVTLFTPLVWGLILLSATVFSIYLFVAAKVGNYIGLSSISYEDFIVPFRLSVPESAPVLSNSLNINMELVFPRGFSANFVFIIWGIFAAVISYAFLAIFRDILLMPVYSKTVDTPQDVIDRGLIPIVADGGFYAREHIKDSPIPSYQYLGDLIYVPKDYDEWESLFINEVGILGTHVSIGVLTEWDASLGDYYASEEVIQGLNPYSHYILNKKLRHVEEVQRSILYFDQGGLLYGTKLYIKDPVPPLEKITMVNLFIPFIIIGVGTLLSIISFLCELCMARCQKAGTKETQEGQAKPQVTFIEEIE